MYFRGLGQGATSNCSASSYTDPVTGNTYDACGHLLIAGAPPSVPMSSSILPLTAAASAASPCSFALFGETTCIGLIGLTTLLVLGAIVAFFMMGRKR